MCVLAIACGKGDDKVTLGGNDAQAAYATAQVMLALTSTMEVYANSTASALEFEFGGQPLTFAADPLAEQEQPLTDNQMQSIVADLQAQLEKSTGGTSCYTVEALDTSTIKVSFQSCTFGKATVDGSTTLAFVFEVLKKQVTVTASFDNFTVNARKVEGTLTIGATFSNKSSLTVTTGGSLKVTTTGNAVAELDFNGTLLLGANEMTMNGSGTVVYSGTTYTIEAKDVKVRYGDGAPYAGTATITYKSGPRQTTNSVVLTFSQATVDQGTVEVQINGKPAGSYTLDALYTLFTGA